MFVGRLSGPLRASVPLLEGGICEMPTLIFQIAIITSAIIWATGILVPGAFGLKWLQQWM
ncbi:hypothetical protein ACWGS9_27925 [Bradyrhizobium sp. Arg314]